MRAGQILTVSKTHVATILFPLLFVAFFRVAYYSRMMGTRHLALRPVHRQFSHKRPLPARFISSDFSIHVRFTLETFKVAFSAPLFLYFLVKWSDIEARQRAPKPYGLSGNPQIEEIRVGLAKFDNSDCWAVKG